MAKPALRSQFGQLLDLNHSREQESGADVFGLELVHRVHGTMRNFDALFAWIERRERLPAWTAMLATYPCSGDRLNQLREHAARLSASRRACPRSTVALTVPAAPRSQIRDLLLRRAA